jgi:DNA repair exonuclease SbcCD nuclease subunit
LVHDLERQLKGNSKVKFIHCADVHLDTPLQGLAHYPGAPVDEIRNATRRAFEKVLNAAIAEKVDFLVIAGDLYDTGLKSFESALFFNKEMARLNDVGIDVYLIYGNHDAASKLIKQLRPPPNVKIFRANEPQTILNEELRVAIHGQSFATPVVTEDLAYNYPSAIPNFFNIGVLHTNLGGVSEHANYAPCSIHTLQNKGYQYWALGHVHNGQILCTDPYIVYPGNIQGRNGKEQGEKSCELVSVSESGTISIEKIFTSVVPWIEIEIDASDCPNADGVYETIRSRFEALSSESKERVIAIRLRIVGPTDAHSELNRDAEQVRNETISIANECGNDLFWIERVQVATQPRWDREELLKRGDPIGEVTRIIESLRRDTASILNWESIIELQNKLPVDLAYGVEPMAPDFDALRTAIEEAEGLLLARLLASEVL